MRYVARAGVFAIALQIWTAGMATAQTPQPPPPNVRR
jgi:hypothetical protein